MPTYADAITLLGQKIRDSEAWPSDASKQAEQLRLLYNAAIATLKGIPITRLAITESVALTSAPLKGSINEYALPADTFFFRQDAGIAQFIFDDVVFYPMTAIPKESLYALADNSLHSGRVLFAIDAPAKTLTAMNVNEAKIKHFQTPPSPSAPADDYPISDGNDLELALAVVAAHVSGETIRDGGQSTFQTFLTQLYGDDIDGRPTN